MYLDFFGLNEAPFGLTPNTQFYYQLPPHEEALEVLLTALQSGEGFIKVTGEVGTGKTLLCRKLLNELPESFVTAYFPNPCLNPEKLNQALALELGINVGEPSALSLTDRIHHRLVELKAQNRRVVVLLDEAQALPDESLESLRLFGNLETESSKLLQVVMFGQPELDLRLARGHLRQLRQRISFSYQLRALQSGEVGAYIEHRLRVSGYRGASLFSPRAVRLISRGSRGIPRLINLLAHKSLMLSFGQGQFAIGHREARRAIKDTEDSSLPRVTWRWCMAGGVLVVIGLIGAGFIL
ncbi:ExeA family protein [Dongshaea marina]|uniref:ExeA family protein n=1 Tax=Dongshaea marina TaxID=2047966 RepID=UPI000D3E6C96|nr:AAA family ATPase [Dongshaea marina]